MNPGARGMCRAPDEYETVHDYTSFVCVCKGRQGNFLQKGKTPRDREKNMKNVRVIAGKGKDSLSRCGEGAAARAFLRRRWHQKETLDAARANRYTKGRKTKRSSCGADGSGIDHMPRGCRDCRPSGHRNVRMVGFFALPLAGVLAGIGRVRFVEISPADLYNRGVVFTLAGWGICLDGVSF